MLTMYDTYNRLASHEGLGSTVDLFGNVLTVFKKRGDAEGRC